MKNIVAWFVKNPVAANLLMALMFITGIFGYLNLEREFIPQTTINGMTVSIHGPGLRRATWKSSSLFALKKLSMA